MKKVDFLLFLYLGVIITAAAVITMRSNTVSLGYDLAKMKKNEQQLRQKQVELQSQLAESEKQIRERLLSKKENGKFILPDSNYVIRSNN